MRFLYYWLLFSLIFLISVSKDWCLNAICKLICSGSKEYAREVQFCLTVWSQEGLNTVVRCLNLSVKSSILVPCDFACDQDDRFIVVLAISYMQKNLSLLQIFHEVYQLQRKIYFVIYYTNATHKLGLQDKTKQIYMSI